MTEVAEMPTPTRIVFGTDGWRARVAEDYTMFSGIYQMVGTRFIASAPRFVCLSVLP